jgi:hypothetical protein
VKLERSSNFLDAVVAYQDAARSSCQLAHKFIQSLGGVDRNLLQRIRKLFEGKTFEILVDRFMALGK